MDFSKKIKAVELRKEGKSYTEINKLLGVSKSTLSNWLKDVVLSNKQRLRLSKLQATAYLSAKRKQVASLKHHDEIKESAENEIAKLAKDPFFIAGLMLYWAEGNKKFWSVQFTNFSNRKNKLYEGTCVIKIHSRELLSKILGWKNGVEKLFLNNSMP